MRPLCTTVAGRSTAMESPLPGTGRDDGRRGPSEAARRQDRPSPGAARRPLPARERRLFVASLGTAGSFLSVRSTEQTPLRPFGGGEGQGEVGAQPSHCDAPRRPYMPCVQPRAWCQQTRQHAPRVVHRNRHLAARQCRGDPVGRPAGAVHVWSPGWIACGRCARRWQGDAPRRPYMPCVQPRALHPRTWHRDGPTRCRGGFRTRPYNAPRHPWCKRGDGHRRGCDDFRARCRRARTAQGNARGSDNRPPYRRAMYRRGAGKGKA